jgi:hypothetical protein
MLKILTKNFLHFQRLFYTMDKVFFIICKLKPALLMKYALTFLILTTVLLISCESPHSGANSGGGLVPTNYIVIKDSSFSPAMISLVSGNSITFLNQTGSVQRLMTDDSTTIRDTAIAPNRSFYFKPDTTGTFEYHLVNKVSARGSFIITP